MRNYRHAVSGATEVTGSAIDDTIQGTERCTVKRAFGPTSNGENVNRCTGRVVAPCEALVIGHRDNTLYSLCHESEALCMRGTSTRMT